MFTACSTASKRKALIGQNSLMFKKQLIMLRALKSGTHWPNHWMSEVFGETRTTSETCSVSSAALEAFGATRTLFAPIQHAKSEEVGCRPSEPLDSLIGGVLANQRGVWEGRNTVWTLFFYALRSVISCFHVAPPTYCISHKRRMYTLPTMQIFCWTGQTRGNRVVG